MYCLSDLSAIKSRLLNKFSVQISRANDDGTINDLMAEWGVSFEERMPISPRTALILVIGELSSKKSEYIKVAKKYGISVKQLEFVSYSEAKQLNAARLEYSNVYSDIICGPMPHKIMGLEDATSLIANMKNHPSRYPNILISYGNDLSQSLKITITNFKQLIERSYLYDSLTNL